ncbi:hypothetical protein EXT42_01765 [Pseudoalteromonas sp. CO302Y]|uniref:hypothetical protein n=1 Tax=unclassified Pseudoalteromonas TaxID=194690 RepID=UPI0010237117|nr:hypothetical protein EXT42_01765 [Pseudoalteromonas sp. CO302Y]RZG11123.1 hypothetical protein EXT40_01765 [Pseudoalteromonas sp. CO133X]
MDSIVKQRSDGFDQDGNFLNGQTELLPWPKITLHNSIYDMQSSNPPSHLVNAIPSPFGDGCIYSHTNSNTNIISKYDRNGELLWTFEAASLLPNVDNVHLLHFYDDGVNKWLLGSLDVGSNSNKLFRLNIDGSAGVISPSYLPNTGNVLSIVTLEDNSIYAVIAYGTTRYTYLIDFETMQHVNSVSNGLATHGTTSTAPLFNGSVSFASSTLHSSSSGFASTITVNFAINPDLTFMESKNGKRLIRTEHVHALASMYTVPTQLSKDVFYCKPSTSNAVTAYATYAYQARFYTRKELETWVSNCIYASTGFRIPLSSEV